MIDSLVVQEIFEDVNFKLLVEDKTDIEEFGRLIDEHVRGYSQKKRFSDGLKDITKKVEDAENRLIVARNVGKFKEPDPDDKAMTTNISSFELKQKAFMINTQLQSMIDGGEITYTEKPHVLDNLRSRIAKAKEAGKEKLEEKLEKMITLVCKSESSFVPPVANIEEFHELDKTLQDIQKLEKLSSKNLTAPLRERIMNKADVQGEFDALVETSHMWFETVLEFKPRLHAALAAYAADAEARKKREEDEAFEKKLAEENAALEKKRAAAEEKQKASDQAFEEKLKAKRDEAALKPVKEEPKRVPKPKKYVERVNMQEMFHEEVDYEEVNVAEIQAELEAEAKQREFALALKELKAAGAEAEAAKKLRAAKDSKDEHALKHAEAAAKAATLKSAKIAAREPAKPKEVVVPVKPLKTEEEKLKEQEQKFKAIDEKLAAKRLEAESQPKKEVKVEPKKEKKVANKMSLLDFYTGGEDDFLEQLAVQEAQEKVDRAEAAEAAKEEAARVAVEEEANWAAENAAWEAQEANKYNITKMTMIKLNQNGVETAEGEVEKDAPAAPAPAKVEPVVVKPVPKPKRRGPPVALVNKWGAPAAGAGEVWEGEDDGMDLLDRLAAQEAEEKVKRAAAQAAADKEAAALAAEEEAAAANSTPAVTTSTFVSKFVKTPMGTVAPTANSNPAVSKKVDPMVAAAEAAATKVFKRKPPVEIASKWGAPVKQEYPVSAEQVLQEDEDGEDAEPSLAEAFAGPTLADALTAPKQKNVVAPQAKKKEKKKWGKVDATLIGFDADNLNTWAP